MNAAGVSGDQVAVRLYVMQDPRSKIKLHSEIAYHEPSTP